MAPDDGAAEPAADTLPLGSKLAASVGAITETVSNHGLKQLANPVFNLSLGLEPAVIGLGLALPRLWDALVDPFIGEWSDRTRSRFGRRRPHMAVGAVLAGLGFAALWWFPRGQTDAFYFWYLVLAGAVFYTAASFFIVPWEALLVELTADHRERTRLQAFRSSVAVIGSLALAWLFAATQLPCFRDTIEGVRTVGLVAGAAILVAGLVPVVFLREAPGVQAAATVADEPLRRSWREALGNRPFTLVAAMMVLYGPGLLLGESIALYVNIYHVFDGDAQAASVMHGWMGTLLHGTKLLWIPVMTALAVRWGKRRTLTLCFSLSLVSDVLKWFCYDPASPNLQLLIPLVQSPGMAPAWIIMASMMADTIDWHEAETGQRRAGLLLAVCQWARKTGVTLAFATAGLLLSTTGFEVTKGGDQDPDTLWRLRLLAAGVPALSTCGALLLLRRYPITEACARALRRRIVARRAAA